MQHFKIIGEKDESTGEAPYWSNKDGWVDFDSATLFKKSEMRKVNYPIGSVGFKWIK